MLRDPCTVCVLCMERKDHVCLHFKIISLQIQIFSLITEETLDTEMECDRPEQTSDHIAPPQHTPTSQDRPRPPGTTPLQNRTPLPSTDRDVTSLSEEDQVQFATLVSKAKEQMLQGEAAGALQSYRQAALIYPSNKLQAKILKIQVGSTDGRPTSLIMQTNLFNPLQTKFGGTLESPCLSVRLSADMILSVLRNFM